MRLQTATLLALLATPIVVQPALAQPPSSAPQTAAERTVAQAMAAAEAGKIDAAIALLEPLKRDPQASGPALVLLGSLYLQAGRAQDAIGVLEPLARREPKNPAVLYHAAQALRAGGQIDQAEALLEQSVAIAPVSPAARELGLLRMARRRPDEAFVLLSGWLKNEPKDVEARFAAAQAAVAIGRTAEADQLISALPQDAPSARLLKAESALAAGNAAVALAALKPLLEGAETPRSSTARGLAAEAYLAQKNAAAAVQTLAGKVGDDPQLSLLLARAQRQSGKLGEAAATLKPFMQQVLADPNPRRVSPFVSAIVFEYGQILLSSGRSREAAAAFEIAVKLNPASLESWQSLAEALAGQGDSQRAAAAKVQAEKLAQAQRQALAAVQSSGPSTGGAELQPLIDALVAGQPEKALDLARAEARRVPADPRPRFIEMRVLVSLNRTAEALSVAEKLAAQFPSNADAVYQRGALRLAQGDGAAAERDLRQALEIAPDHPAALNDLAVLLMTQKRFPEAKTLLQRALELNPQDALAAENLKKLPTGP